MQSELYVEVIRRSRVIDVGERRISRVVREFRGKSRFVIYLPTTRNDVWMFLWERKIPVKIFIEIPEGAIEKPYKKEQGGDRG
jgi:hypothetical protein